MSVYTKILWFDLCGEGKIGEKFVFFFEMRNWYVGNYSLFTKDFRIWSSKMWICHQIEWKYHVLRSLKLNIFDVSGDKMHQIRWQFFMKKVIFLNSLKSGPIGGTLRHFDNRLKTCPAFPIPPKIWILFKSSSNKYVFLKILLKRVQILTKVRD